MKNLLKFGMIALLANILWVSTASLAGGSHDHDHSDKGTFESIETEFGKYSPQMHPTVTIKISMSDDMRFTPATIQVKQGDIVEFIHANEGQLMHEFILGTYFDSNEVANIPIQESNWVDNGTVSLSPCMRAVPTPHRAVATRWGTGWVGSTGCRPG